MDIEEDIEESWERKVKTMKGSSLCNDKMNCQENSIYSSGGIHLGFLLISCVFEYCLSLSLVFGHIAFRMSYSSIKRFYCVAGFFCLKLEGFPKINCCLSVCYVVFFVYLISGQNINMVLERFGQQQSWYRSGGALYNGKS